MSKVFLLIFLFNLSPFIKDVKSEIALEGKSTIELRNKLNECIKSLPKARNLLNLSNCLFQYRQFLVVNNIQPDQIKDYPELVVFRKELDNFSDLLALQMLTPKMYTQVPQISSKTTALKSSKQLIELLAILQFSPVITREILNETIFSYNNLIVLLGLVEPKQIEFYPIINSIGIELEKVRRRIT